MPYWVDKLERLHHQPPSGMPKSNLPSKLAHEYIQEGRVFFSCELDEKRIADTAEAVGDDCILYASDIPHAHRVFDALKIFHDRKDIEESTKKKILEENGPRFFNVG